MSALNVVKLDQGNLQDIPQMMRRLADKIERGEQTALDQAVMVACTKEGTIDVWMWGDCPNRQQGVGLLHWGIDQLIRGD